MLALYTDSDMFDGFTNREGFGVYVARELAANTELKLSLWDGRADQDHRQRRRDGPYNPLGRRPTISRPTAGACRRT